ncbi:sulfatase family protein [Nocardioides sp. GXQ0305]|uniref:sulfatase family protein n=1 Tax=Nocardioides sp. GXQ0305 TaxID=3423912 RepID=UPI003D7E9E86
MDGTRERRRVRLARTGLVVAVIAGAGALASPSTSTGVEPARAAAPVQAEQAEQAARAIRRPNIVFFLTDDMATSHLRHMPATRRLIFDRGARFTDYYTNISLCCPARASLLTGKYAHNTGIIGNEFPDGFHGFHRGDERRRTFAVALRRQGGYRTSLIGKYLNEYPFVDSAPRHAVRPTFVPPGWSDWAVPVRGQFEGTSYDINLNGRIRHREAPANYLGDFMTRRAVRQIRANRDDRGLAIVLSFYGPHEPAPAAPAERRNAALQRRIAQVRYPRTADFNERDVSDKPRFIRDNRRMGPRTRRAMDRIYRRQLLSVASIDRHVRVVVRALRRTRQLDDTYLVFTSDHGIHLGNHRLLPGKNTAYVTDSHVPFAIRGPGIRAGSVVRRVTGPIDIAPTFADMANVSLPWVRDGASVLPLAKGRSPEDWRSWILVRRGRAKGGSARAVSEPLMRAEARRVGAGWFRGVIGSRWRYVRYGTGEQELYDDRVDPHQLRNIMALPVAERTAEQVAALRRARRAVRALTACAGVADCRR